MNLTLFYSEYKSKALSVLKFLDLNANENIKDKLLVSIYSLLRCSKKKPFSDKISLFEILTTSLINASYFVLRKAI